MSAPGPSPATNIPDQLSASHARRGALRFVSMLPAAGILLIALALRLLGLTQTEAWRDEAITLLHARSGWGELLLRLPFVEDTPPLGFLLFKAWMVAGRGEIWARLLPVFLGTATVAVLMATARRLHPASWWGAGLLAATSYEFVYYSQEIRVYALLVLATAVCFLAAERSLVSRRWIILQALVGALAAHCHSVGLFVYPMALSYRLARAPLPRSDRRTTALAAGFWALLALPIVVFSTHWSRVHAAEGTWWADRLSLNVLQILARRFMALAQIRRWSELEHCAWLGFGLEQVVMFAALALLAAALLDPRLRRRALALVVACTLYLGLMLLSSLVALPNVSERTILPAWVPVVLLLSLGSAAGGRRLRVLLGGCLVAIACAWAFAWTWTATDAPPRRPLSRAAMLWLGERVQPGDLIVSGPYGYEDIIPYHIGDRISGEQLLSEGIPVYGGRPARHLLIYRRPDPAWQSRLEQALANRRASQTRHSVWVVRYGWNTFPQPGSIEEIVARTHQPVDRYLEERELSTSVTRFVPIPSTQPGD